MGLTGAEVVLGGSQVQLWRCARWCWRWCCRAASLGGATNKEAADPLSGSAASRLLRCGSARSTSRIWNHGVSRAESRRSHRDDRRVAGEGQTAPLVGPLRRHGQRSPGGGARADAVLVLVHAAPPSVSGQPAADVVRVRLEGPSERAQRIYRVVAKGFLPEAAGHARDDTRPSTSSPNLSSFDCPMPGMATSPATSDGSCSAIAASVASVKTQ